MRLFSLALCLLGLALAASIASAQTDPDIRRVVLVDGSVIVGTIVDESADPLVVLSRDGLERRIPRARVAEITGLIAGRFTRLDPTRSRLLFTPTARTIGARSTRLSLLSYILPNVAYGITDRVDLSATGFFTFGDGAILPVLGAKGTIVSQNGVDVALGLSAAVQLGGDFNDGGFVGIPYGVVTVGSEVASVNAAVGGAFGGALGQGDIGFAEGFIVSVGGERQLSNSLKVLGEVIVPFSTSDDVDIDDVRGVALVGLRFFGERFSFDVFGIAAGVNEQQLTFDPSRPESGRTEESFKLRGLAPFLSATYRF